MLKMRLPCATPKTPLKPGVIRVLYALDMNVVSYAPSWAAPCLLECVPSSPFLSSIKAQATFRSQGRNGQFDGGGPGVILGPAAVRSSVAFFCPGGAGSEVGSVPGCLSTVILLELPTACSGLALSETMS